MEYVVGLLDSIKASEIDDYKFRQKPTSQPNFMFSSEYIEGYHIDVEQMENRFNQSGLSQVCETIRTLRVCMRKELKQWIIGI